MLTIFLTVWCLLLHVKFFSVTEFCRASVVLFFSPNLAVKEKNLLSLKIESVTGDWHKRPTRNHFECYTHFILWSEEREVLWIWREAEWELYTKNTPGRNSQGSKSNIKRLQTLNSVFASFPLLWQRTGIFNEGPSFSCPSRDPVSVPRTSLSSCASSLSSSSLQRIGSGMKKSI